jgi:hypothetical protein
MPDFAYADLLPRGEDGTPYRLLTQTAMHGRIRAGIA